MLDSSKGMRTALSDIIHFYRMQIARLEDVGIGNETEFGTTVTNQLLDITRRRLCELQDKRLKLVKGISRNGLK